MNTEEHVTRALQNATKFTLPFPYFFAENVFPDDIYAQIQHELDLRLYHEGTGYQNRIFADDSLFPGLEFMATKPFFKNMLNLFPQDLRQGFGGAKHYFKSDTRLIRDSKNYKIGPHTDGPWKVLSLLFYLPPDEDMRDLGTSFFVPKDETFRCPGGKWHKFEPFREVWRAPFIPNSCLGFWKTDYSFHGVHPIPVPVRRDVLLYNIYRGDIDGEK